MITGKLVNDDLIIDIEIGGPVQATRRIEAVIDTGFNGELTLPGTLVSALQLPFAGHQFGALADGSVVTLDIFSAAVVWHGQRKDVLVSEAAGLPLVGIALLKGSRLTADIVDGGGVAIQELQQQP